MRKLIISLFLMLSMTGNAFCLPSVALITADSSSSNLTDVKNKLTATGRFAVVDGFNFYSTSPDMGDLSRYDSILVWSNYAYQTPHNLGNLLADYVDEGGGVVTAVFQIAGTNRLGGRWQTGGYQLIDTGIRSFITGQAYLGDILVTDHPILDNVSAFDGGSSGWRPGTHTLAGGASLIAKWSDSSPLVVVKEMVATRRVDLGFYPVSKDSVAGSWPAASGGLAILANALEWAAYPEKRTPALQVAPSQFTMALTKGETAGNAFTITNAGDGDLEFSISARKLFWSVPGLNRTVHGNPDGASVQTVNHYSHGLAVDAVNGRLYQASKNSIKSSRLDLSETTTLVSGLTNATGIAVDWANGKIYWTDYDEGTVNRVNSDGGNMEILAPGLKTPWGIDLDLVAGKIYWSETDGNSIRRANLDGTGMELLISAGIVKPRGIKIDHSGGRIYFAEGGNSRISVADLDGSNRTTLLSQGCNHPLDIALDLENRKIYWTDWNLDTIKEADLNGTNIKTLIQYDADGPVGLALFKNPGWLTGGAVNGLLIPEADQEISFSVDATQLSRGMYASGFFVNSNDPAARETFIPLSLQVQTTEVVVADLASAKEVVTSQDSIEISARLFSDLSTVGRGEYFINESGAPGSGTPLQPVDGAFGGSSEEVAAIFPVPAEWGTEKTYTLFVRGQNEQGEWGTAESIEILHAGPNTLVVPNQYATIQLAVNAALAGDIIFVRKGRYQESLTLSKAITLIGENRDNVILDGANNLLPVAITADDVILRGFTVTRGRNGNVGYGIKMIGADNCSIGNNSILLNTGSYSSPNAGNGYGIYLNASHNNQLEDNVVAENAGAASIYTGGKGYGVYLENSSGNIISNSTIRDNAGGNGYYSGSPIGSPGYGIYLKNSDQTRISSSHVSGNRGGVGSTGYGIVFDNSSYNLIEKSTVSAHNCGILLTGAAEAVIGDSLAASNILAGNYTAISNQTANEINARYNDFGATEYTETSNKIYDCKNNASYGCVIFYPFLGQSTPVAIRDFQSSSDAVFVDSEDFPISATLYGLHVEGAEYFIDLLGDPGTGQTLAPVDGAFDGPIETVSGSVPIPPEWQLNSAHTIYIRGMAEEGVWGEVQSIPIYYLEAGDIAISPGSSIQQAIDTAAADSVIIVLPGTYHEHLVFDKPITLKGIDRENTIIDGSRNGIPITIQADNVTIEGMTLTRGQTSEQVGWDFKYTGCGIKLLGASGSSIKNNIITGNDGYDCCNGESKAYGIYVENATNITVSGNKITANHGGGWNDDPAKWDGFGIYMLNSADNTIVDNEISDNSGGHGELGLPGSGHGIYLSLSPRNVIRDNRISANNGGSTAEVPHWWEDYEPGSGYGIFISESPDIVITGNAIADHWGSKNNQNESIGSGYGIYLENATGIRIGGQPGDSNNFTGNQNYNLANYSVETVTATYNDWGVAEIELIGALIFDCADDSAYGCVQYLFDNCPDDPEKLEPGVCGCGVVDTDTDGDGAPDCNDLCPEDPGKTVTGVCGCGVADTDTDGDTVADCLDAFPLDPARWLGEEARQNYFRNALIALQVSAGGNPAQLAELQDINSDGRIGMEEALYFLQMAAELRQ